MTCIRDLLIDSLLVAKPYSLYHFDPKLAAYPYNGSCMAMIPVLSKFVATQGLDCRLVARVASARKDLAVFRKAQQRLTLHKEVVTLEAEAPAAVGAALPGKASHLRFPGLR
jgi:hypothetical protein